MPTFQIGFRKRKIGPSLRQVGLRLGKRGLERATIYGEEQVALLHQLTVLEVDGIEVARHPGAHFDGVDGDEAPNIFIMVRH